MEGELPQSDFENGKRDIMRGERIRAGSVTVSPKLDIMEGELPRSDFQSDNQIRGEQLCHAKLVSKRTACGKR